MYCILVQTAPQTAPHNDAHCTNYKVMVTVRHLGELQHDHVVNYLKHLKHHKP